MGLGSVVAVTNASGGLVSHSLRSRYLPFGQVREDVPVNGPRITQTDYGFTGQRNVADLGLMDYRARMYDAALGRFTQPDTIGANAANPQSLNRFTYVANNPILLNDPTGHKEACGSSQQDCDSGLDTPLKPPKPPIDDDNEGKCDINPLACGSTSQSTPMPNQSAPASGPGPTISNNGPTVSAPPPPGDADQLRMLGYWTHYGKMLIDLLVAGANAGRPLYKQIRPWATFGPVIEGGAGALGQIAEDYNDPRFTASQKAVRALIVGVEDGITEGVSDLVTTKTTLGGAGFGSYAGPWGTAGGAVAGYALGSYATTQFMDNAIWSHVNDDLIGIQTGLFP